MSERAAFIAATVEWLNTRLLPPGRSVTPRTPLFEGGLIDSIRILKLIAWTEQATGRRIPDEQVRMECFHSVERMADVFVKEASHVDG